MMRPTTSSASKTADKPEMAPPKKVQVAKKPATKDTAPKAHAAPATSSAAPKPTNSATVSKSVAKETKPAVTSSKEAPKEAPKQATTEAAKEAPKDVSKPAVEPTLNAEPSIPEIAQGPSESSAVETAPVVNAPEPEAEEAQVAKAEELEVEHSKAGDEPLIPETANNVPAEEEQVVEPVPADTPIEDAVAPPLAAPVLSAVVVPPASSNPDQATYVEVLDPAVRVEHIEHADDIVRPLQRINSPEHVEHIENVDIRDEHLDHAPRVEYIEDNGHTVVVEHLDPALYVEHIEDIDQVDDAGAFQEPIVVPAAEFTSAPAPPAVEEIATVEDPEDDDAGDEIDELFAQVFDTPSAKHGDTTEDDDVD
jgi:hypothetical protein